MSENTDLRARLESLPELIKNAQIELLKHTDEANLLSKDIEKIEAEIKAEVANDETLTNDTKRRAAVTQKLSAREDYSNRVNTKSFADWQVRMDQISLEFLRDQFKACQSIALIQAPQGIQINLGRQ